MFKYGVIGYISFGGSVMYISLGGKGKYRVI